MGLQSNELVEPQTVTFEETLELESKGRLDLLICHALSGNHHVAGRYDDSGRTNGWWHLLVGPGKPIDTDKFFVVCSNNIGGCDGSTAPSLQ